MAGDTHIATLGELRDASSVDRRSRDEQIGSLLEERRGYETRGLPDRVAQVDAELARLGHLPAVPPAAAAALRRRLTRT